MSTTSEHILRAYRPLYLRGAMVEGAWLHRPLPARDRSPQSRRLSLLAWVTMVLPRRVRSRP